MYKVGKCRNGSNITIIMTFNSCINLHVYFNHGYTGETQNVAYNERLAKAGTNIKLLVLGNKYQLNDQKNRLCRQLSPQAQRVADNPTQKLGYLYDNFNPYVPTARYCDHRLARYASNLRSSFVNVRIESVNDCEIRSDYLAIYKLRKIQRELPHFQCSFNYNSWARS